MKRIFDQWRATRGMPRLLSPVMAPILMCLCAALLRAATANYSEPWTSTLDGWAFTQLSCSGTCTNALSTDGNPADGVSAKLTGRSKVETGYWKLTATWTALGVPPGDTVDSVDGQWDDKAVQTAVACLSSSTMGMQIFDSANATEITSAAVEANINVSGDTAAWTNHNPTGAVSVTSSNAAGSTVTLRFNLNPASGNNASAACELRGDNFRLGIVSHIAPKGRSRIYHLGVMRIPWMGTSERRTTGVAAPLVTGKPVLRSQELGIRIKDLRLRIWLNPES